MVKAHNALSELVINWDQAGVEVVPSQNWTMEQQGARQVEIAAINDKQQMDSICGTQQPLGKSGNHHTVRQEHHHSICASSSMDFVCVQLHLLIT